MAVAVRGSGKPDRTPSGACRSLFAPARRRIPAWYPSRRCPGFSRFVTVFARNRARNSCFIACYTGNDPQHRAETNRCLSSFQQGTQKRATTMFGQIKSPKSDLHSQATERRTTFPQLALQAPLAGPSDGDVLRDRRGRLHLGAGAVESGPGRCVCRRR